MLTTSVIIPTFNEAENIGRLVRHLQKQGSPALREIIVADGGSMDETLAIANEFGATAILSPAKGRAAQMNFGASKATGDILYFVHADCLPPASFLADIQEAVAGRYDLGRYRSRYTSEKPIFRLQAFFTRFDFFFCMGGDQSLFVKKSLFDAVGGFMDSMRIMEEFEFCERARKNGRYTILSGAVEISLRKYEQNSWLTVQRANSRVVKLYRKGASQQAMLLAYQQMLSYRKNAF